MSTTELLKRLGTKRAPAPKEFVVEATGHVRQAGSDPTSESQPWLKDFILAAEANLYIFAKSVLGLDRLTKTLHLPLCEWLQKCPPYRKLYMLPRDCLKTSIARSLTIHLLIQHKQRNIYIPGKHGPDTRILYAGEIIENAMMQMSWVMDQYTHNKRLRALWPHLMWDNPLHEAKQWSTKGMIVKRGPKYGGDMDYPEPSIRPIGVGGAIAGYHGDVQIKDDLVTHVAARSAAMMQAAKDWHVASRPLFDDPAKGLEFILGTHWSIGDLYDDIKKDPSVEAVIRAAIEDGKPIFPEYLPLEELDRLAKELGSLFPLLYMNNAADPGLVDFDVTLLRYYHIRGTDLVLTPDSRDFMLAERQVAHIPPSTDDSDRGKPLSEVLDRTAARDRYLRFHS